jgi:hypothetical protein
VAARDWALGVLEAMLVHEQRTAWFHPAGLPIQILTAEKLFDAAWGAVRKHGASIGLKPSLARACEATHPREAVQTYTERVDQLAEGGGNPAYQEAIGLIGRMAGLRGAEEQAAYVAGLRVRFHRKRNFMKLLT